jgi:hypothetical protein
VFSVILFLSALQLGHHSKFGSEAKGADNRAYFALFRATLKVHGTTPWY